MRRRGMNAIEVTLSDGTRKRVREPKAKESAGTMAALLPVVKLSDALGRVEPVALIQSVMSDPEATEKLLGVVALLSDTPREEIDELGQADYFALLGATITLCLTEGSGPLARKTPSRSRSTKAR
jgi:hypothetical protein